MVAASGYARSPSPRRAWIEISLSAYYFHQVMVALPTEGVDRNSCRSSAWAAFCAVALPTEGVDRNLHRLAEIAGVRVALPTEGVDRNPYRGVRITRSIWSPSPRRAWIEIVNCRKTCWMT